MKKAALIFFLLALSVVLYFLYNKYFTDTVKKDVQVFTVDKQPVIDNNVSNNEESANDNANAAENHSEGSNIEESEINRYDKVKLSMVGDILVHDTQLSSQYDEVTKQYDFKNNFKYIKKYIEKADVAIANFETVLGGDKEKYRGFPTFNSPDSIADALKYAGFDMFTTANNHILDCGLDGLIRTNTVLKEKGFQVLGTRENDTDNGYIVAEINNIKIGFTNYTFETGRKGNRKTLNSVPMPAGADKLLDSFNYGNLDKDLEEMKLRIGDMKSQGAEFIVFFMHWGDEYERQPNINQKKLAQSLSDIGVDVIIGGHPHVLQPMDVLQSKSGKKTFVAYSMGNFLSNQCYERLNNRYPEDGMILTLSIKKDRITKAINIEDINYIPTWVHRAPKEGEKYTYEIIPLTDALKYKESYGLSTKDSQWRAENSMKNTDEVMTSAINKIDSMPVFKQVSEDISENSILIK